MQWDLSDVTDTAPYYLMSKKYIHKERKKKNTQKNRKRDSEINFLFFASIPLGTNIQ